MFQQKRSLIHMSTYQGNVEVYIDCDWPNSQRPILETVLEEQPADPQPILPIGIFIRRDDQLYTFDKNLVTCENCIKW